MGYHYRYYQVVIGVEGGVGGVIEGVIGGVGGVTQVIV